MKIKELPLSLKERWCERLRKLLVFLMIIVTILTSVGIFIFKDFGLGYKYYEINNNQTVLVGVTQEENLLTKTVDEHLNNLENDGYYIVSSSLNITLLENFAIIPKSTQNDEELKALFIKSLDVSILCTKLQIEGDETVYYFKTQSECDDFVKSLNQYIEQKTESEGITSDYRIITKQEILDNKLNNVKKEKEELDAKKAAEEAARKAEQERRQREQRQVTSRGGEISSRSSNTPRGNYSGGAPLASYVYISSPYGMRHGKMHTGVDFAANGGTHIYAWKDGTVTFAGWSGSYGNFIIVQHNDGTVSRYAHCSGFAVSSGTYVSKGQTIGYVGTTGNSTGNHLHFEIQINGSFVNPLDYL